jgi:asparagine synthase (glutamine-hydrolysing)
MCGLIAAFNVKNFNKKSAKIALKQLSKRGPDSEGQWNDSETFLGFRRLSVIDLNSRSDQPMESACGKFIIVFNGEIYNFKKIKEDLIKKNIKFFNTSDTEVLLNLFILEGEKMLIKLRGMFSFIIYNKKTKAAFIARDQYGIKPLYYGKTDKGLIFASQVKTILEIELVDKKKDKFAFFLFSIFGSVPEPFTLFKNIKSIKAGHFLWIKKGRIVTYQKWCDVSDVLKASLKNNHTNKNDIKLIIKNALKESVDYHLTSDVPVGIFLSAGIDSSVLAGLIKENGVKNLIGITIYFDEFLNTSLHELNDAKKVAKYYNIHHYTRKVTKKEFLEDLPKIFEAMDQPSIDGINTWYASKAAAELKLKVVISGIGGDELFFGYNHYRRIVKLESLLKILRNIPFFYFTCNVIGKLFYFITKNNKFNFLSKYLNSIKDLWFLKRSFSLSKNGINQKFNNNEFSKKFSFFYRTIKYFSSNPYLALAELEVKNYLRNTLLRDSDWASMYHSIELRTPFVDYYLLKNLKNVIVYFPQYSKKILLNSTLEKKLPKFILKRKKTGFAIPIKDWLSEITSTNHEDLSKFIAKSCYPKLLLNEK